MALTTQQISERLLKKSQGFAETNFPLTVKGVYNEKYGTYNLVKPTDIWTDAALIPSVAPTGMTSGSTLGVVKYYDKLLLQIVDAGESVSFMSPSGETIDAITGKFAYEYTPKFFSNDGFTPIFYGDPLIDAETGIVTFYNVSQTEVAINANNPPRISFYKYVGTKGVGNFLPTTGGTLTGYLNVVSGVTAKSFITSGGTSSQFLKADGSLDSTVYFKEPISIAYSSLYSLVTTSGLTVGQRYIINDYQTVYTIPNTSIINTGITEPLLVTAISTSNLMNIAYSTLYPKDVIYYDIVNNETMVPGCNNTNGGKGYIYRRIDTLKNNDIGFDYRNVKFRRWQISVTDTDTDGSVSNWNKGDVVLKTGTAEIYLKLNSRQHAQFTDTSSWKIFEWHNLQYVSPFASNWYINDDKFWLVHTTSNYKDYNMFSTVPTTGGTQSSYDYIYENKFYGNNLNIIDNSNSVFFGDSFNNNTIANSFQNNTIGNYFYNNTIGECFSNNTIAGHFYNNTIAGYVSNNTIGEYSTYNTIADEYSYNVIGMYFYFNTIGNSFNYNTIGNSFNYNTIGNNFNYNNIGTSFNYNTIGDNFNYTTGMDFTDSHYVYMSFNKELYTTQGWLQKLRYYDDTDSLVILNANA